MTAFSSPSSSYPHGPDRWFQFYSKKFLFRFFGKATKYFDLGMIMMIMIITTFLVHFVPKSTWFQNPLYLSQSSGDSVKMIARDYYLCRAQKFAVCIHIWHTKFDKREFFYFRYPKNSRCCITPLKCSMWYYIPRRIFMSI